MDSSRSLRVGRPVLAGLGLVHRWIALLALLVSCYALAPPAAAQAPARNGPRFSPDDSEDAERQLQNAANQARNQQWSEAIDIYQRVIDRYGEKVVKLPKGEPGRGPRAGVRALRRRTPVLPPPHRRRCRRRHGSSIVSGSIRWRSAGFAEGARNAITALLRRVVDQAFCSSWGDDALELLGDLAFQDGRFGEALADYAQLVPDRPDDPFSLVHPDPSVDLARVAAKKWLCLAASASIRPTPADLDAFARRYPGAKGGLAGRKGSYATILADSIAGDHLALPGQPDGRWPTFAGSLRRTRIAPGRSTSGRPSGGWSWRRSRRIG